MRRFSFRKPSPAMAVAFIALLAALSGSAIALPGKNTVDSGDIKNRAVKAKDIANGAVTTPKIRNGAVNSQKVRNDSLTGTDVNESTLGQVPSANTAASATNANNAANAANAANADRLDNKDSSEFLPSSGQAPSGYVMRGNFGLAEFQAPTNDTATEISFPLALASGVPAHYINQGAAPPPQCPGTVSNPQAQAGNLCIYEGAGSNPANVTKVIADPTDGATGEANQWGTTLIFIAGAGGNDNFARGTWAVTAP